jgi:hypothetical protein
MLHLHIVPEPGRLIMRSHAFHPMRELMTRLMLMHLPFEYRCDGHWHIITSEAAARSALGSPPFDAAERIIVEEG